MLELECGDVPLAAVGAMFAHAVSATGGTGSLTFAGTVPEGLTIDAATGTIAGVPTTAGDVTLELDVTDATGATGTASCDLSIREQLGIDLALDLVPYCLSGASGSTLLDAVVEGTGDDTMIACDHPGGTGNGSLPAGITIDPATCELQGTVTESRYGTWAFIVRGQQSGAAVHIPYCVSNDEQGAFTITADHSGRTDNALEPYMATFDPSQPVFAAGPGDPLIRVVDPEACDGSCDFFSYSFFINPSAFDAGENSVDIYDEDGDDDTTENKPTVVEGMLYNDGATDVGMTHGLRFSSNTPIGEPLDGRIWVVNLDLDYCLGTNAAACDSPGDEEGFFVFSVIMVPEP